MPAHEFPILAFGFALALVGAPILLFAAELAGGNSLGWPFRLSLWALAGIEIGIARSAMTHPATALGLLDPSWRTAVGAAVATLITLAGAPIFHHIHARIGNKTIAQNDTFRETIAFSVAYRLFLVVTAAVTEEVLYRGFAIGIGEDILGSRSAAVALSLIVFVGAHFRWGLGHMLSVLWAAMVLTALFVITHDLFACIAAHAALDLIGLIIAPEVMAARDRGGGPAHR